MAIETAQGPYAHSLLNTPVPLVRRTLRELVCLGVGAWILVSELQQPANGWLFHVNIALAVTFTTAFALRFFLARILATAAAFSCGAQWWIGRPESWSTPLDLNWRAYACIVVAGVLASGDLVRRFDRGGAPGWWPNPWATLSRSSLVAVRWSLYLLCVLTAIIHQGYTRSQGAVASAQQHIAWVPTYTACLGLVLIALALGRRPALLALPALCLWTLLELMPRPAPTGQTQLLPPVIFGSSPQVARPALAITTVALLLTSWLALRLLRRRLE